MHMNNLEEICSKTALSKSNIKSKDIANFNIKGIENTVQSIPSHKN